MCQCSKDVPDDDESRVVRVLATAWVPLTVVGIVLAWALFFVFLAVLARWVIHG